ncbi:MAG: tetratricopeptide repeat protein, partial [Alphaproteobacteria bacterium]
DYELAVADFSAMFEVDPANRNAGAGRALAYLHLGRVEEALADLDAAIEVNSRFAGTRYLRGLAYDALGQSDEALIEFAEAISLDRNFNFALDQRGRVLLSQGRLDEARADFEASLEIEPFDSRAFAGLGLVAERAGDIPLAIQHYRVSQMLDPNLYEPAQRLPQLVEEPAAPDARPLEFIAPAEGLVVQYLEVTNVAGDTPDPEMEISDRLWLAGPAQDPTPAGQQGLRFVLGETKDGVSDLTVALLFTNATTQDVRSTYSNLLLPLRSEVEEGPERFNVLREVDTMWLLTPGETTSGTGRLMFDCPEVPGPQARLAGCAVNVPNARAGTLQWTGTFVGWEYVLVPAGNRLTARFEFETVWEIGFGENVTTVGTTVVWYDPDIGWWVKRETTENDVVTTAEAVSITLPEPEAPAE